VLLSAFFAIPGPFFFWKEVKTNPFHVGGEHLRARRVMITSHILSERDEDLGTAVQFGFKRIRSWRVPPNWSNCDWFEELTAVGMAAAWQAVCEFDPEREVPLAGFAYCRMMTRCLARYRKEWRYVLHVAVSDAREEATTFKHLDFVASSTEKVNGAHPSNDHLRDVVSALPAAQRRMIEQLFWKERTEIEVANTMGINQSTINRRKHDILKGLRMKLRDRNEFQKFSA
jgi:RNA polymerase sigma factor (sigma-70 family)